MVKEQFEDRLWSIIPPDHLNEWEREELINLVAGFDHSLDDLILQQIAAIWPVSTALCFSILEELDDTLQQGLRRRRTARNVHINRHVFINAGDDVVSLLKGTAAVGATSEAIRVS